MLKTEKYQQESDLFLTHYFLIDFLQAYLLLIFTEQKYVLKSIHYFCVLKI